MNKEGEKVSKKGKKELNKKERKSQEEKGASVNKMRESEVCKLFLLQQRSVS